jgi:hypothetical protein
VPGDAAQATVDVLDSTRVKLVGVRPAAEVAPLVGPRRFLHSGPPIALDELPGPTRGAVAGALVFEGEARDVREAEAILERGEVELVPCQDAGAGGAIAGIVSPRMPVVVVESDRGTVTFSPLNEGMGRALRFGANGDETLRRLAWLRDVFAPLLDRAIGTVDVELTELQAEGLRRGDECHNRTVATSTALLLRIAPALYRVARDLDAADRVLADAQANPHFFVPFSIAAAKAIADAAHGIPGSPIVTGSGGNGVRYGIRVSGLGDRWLTAPAPRAQPKLFPGFEPGDAQPTLGDSLVIETVGLGAFALAAAPAVCAYIGGTPAETSALVTEMRAVSAGTSSRFLIPFESFAGAPLGIDVSLVAETGIEPLTNTGLAHRRPGVGQVGAGLTRLPLAPFREAASLLARAGAESSRA